MLAPGNGKVLQVNTECGPSSLLFPFKTFQLLPFSWSGCSGRIANAIAAPNSINIIEPTNGRFQLPVVSMIQPATTGDTITANAEPTFISPLAGPENCGAMSIGIAHIGPMASSAKEKPRLRQNAAT